MTSQARMIIGWREWVALPLLGLPAIKAKVDTGAKTSSLHAFRIETFERVGRLHVRFRVHPIQGRKDVVVLCEAPVIDHRSVSDSGGHREKRFVIQTTITIGSLTFPIEVTLANRESMTHRMLIGRSAMAQLAIDPSRSYLLGRPLKSARIYADSQKLYQKPQLKRQAGTPAKATLKAPTKKKSRKSE